MKNLVEFDPNLKEGDEGWIPDAPPDGDNEMCDSSASHYGCTLPKGHSGKHAAHGLASQLIATWEDE